jgi:Patatin-like phospholipase
MGITTLEETGRPDAAADGAEAGNRAQAATPLSEEEAFQARRRRLGIADDAPRIGLALSGGGIRSATFCLGLLRGLARQGVLSRFDYLSTVSGGGYIGAMFGRLVQRVGILQAQAILADSDSRPLWWLRRYGRYLAPGGARDYGIGIATFLRAFLAVHVEFAFLALTIGLATVFLHALHAQTGVFGQTAWHEWKSALWPLAAIVWLLLAPGLMGAYWMLRDPPRTAVGNARDARFRPWDAAVACTSAVAGGILLGGLWSAGDAIVPPPSIRLWMGCVLSGLGVSGLVLAFHLWRRRLDVAVTTVATARRDLTALLRAVNLIAAVLALLRVRCWSRRAPPTSRSRSGCGRRRVPPAICCR